MSNPYASGNDPNPFAEDVAKTAAPVPSGPTSPDFTSPPQPFYTPTPNAQNPEFVPVAIPGVAPTAGPGQPYIVPQPPAFQQEGTAIPQARDLDTAKVWTIEYYQQFFNVDTRDVCERLACSLIPFSPPAFLKARNWHFGPLPFLSSAASNFTGEEERAPDMYGPFWLTTTLWMVVGIVGNMMSNIAHYRSTENDKGTWHYDFKEASIACATFYAYVVIMSLVVWGVMKWQNVPATLVDTIAVFGYSMVTLVLAAILCGIPSVVVHWIVCIFAGFWSLLYILLNFWRLWKNSMGMPWFIGLIAFVSVFHIGLTLSLKFYFFNYNI